MILAALTLSGLAGLLFEILATRVGILILGTTTTAVTAVLSTFMAGLALGNFASKKILPRISSPALAFAASELWVVLASAILYYQVSSPDRVGALSGVEFVFFMFLPTVGMGLSTPFAIATNSSVSWAYGLNTLGGAMGALLGALWWLPDMGLLRTWQLSFLLTMLAVLMAAFFSLRRSKTRRAFQAVAKEKIPTHFLILAAWLGGSGLALEIVWTRLLSLILGPSVYAFGMILFVFLLGIAAGSVVSSLLPKGRLKNIDFGVLLLASAFSVAWSLVSFGFLPYIFVELAQKFRPTPHQLRWIELLLSALSMLPAAVLQGIFIPVLIQKCSKKSVASSAAGILGWNTLGAIVGSVLTGLVLVPHVGFLGILLAIFGLNYFLGCTRIVNLPMDGMRKMRPFLLALAAVFLGVFVWNARNFWDEAVLSSGVYKYAVGEALRGNGASIQVGKILYYREGISSTVAVIQTQDDRVLSIDGKADATAFGDQSTQILLGALPLSLSKETKEALVIGFASGMTSGVSSRFEGTRVTSVEIEPAVYEASKYFEDVNMGPLAYPHLLTVGDGRHFLKKTQASFDIITSEPSNPWMSGVAPLFTKEFFQLARRRLKEGGVMCQWLPIYGMSSDLIGSIMKTYAAVFPNVLVFESVEGGDLLMIGSEKPLVMDAAQMEMRWKDAGLRKKLTSIGIERGVDLIGKFLMGTEGVHSFEPTSALNTDENGYVEYRAPLSLHLKTASHNNEILSEATDGILNYVSDEMKTDKMKKQLETRFSTRNEIQNIQLLWR